MVKIKDKLILNLLEKHTLKPLQKGFSVFEYLVKSIIYQQLSTKTADSIFKKFLNWFQDGKYYPGEILLIEEARLRSCGISFSKIK